MAVGTIRFGRALFCGPSCFGPALRSALHAEHQQARHAAGSDRGQPEGRIPLGRILVEQGAVTEEQLDRALCSQREAGTGKLGSWLKQQAGLSEGDLAAALGIQWRCPVFRVGTFEPKQMASYLPRQLMESCCALPLRVTGSPQRLALCFEDHVDRPLMEAVGRMHGIAVDAGLLTANGYWQAARELLGVRLFPAKETETDSIEGVLEEVFRFTAETAARSLRAVAVHGRFWVRVLTPPDSGRPPYRDLLCTLRPGLQ